MCDKLFPEKRNLKDRFLIHTGEKPSSVRCVTNGLAQKVESPLVKINDFFKDETTLSQVE